MNIAIISDIHANLIALKAVLKDIKTRNISQIYCLGDLVDFAVWGNEVIDLFREHHIPCLLGNHDERIAFDLPVVPLPHHEPKETSNRFVAIDYSKATISEVNKRWLAQLPLQIALTFSVAKKRYTILLVHASPQSNDEYIYQSHSKSSLLEMLGGRKPDALLMGHTHLSYIEKHDEVLFVNCGSVGRSKEPDHKATYSILTLDENGIDAEIIKVDYDINYVANAIYESPIPDFYADFLLDKL